MIDSPVSRPHVVLYEGPRSQPLDAPLRVSLLQNLLERGYPVRRVCGSEIALDQDGQTATTLVLGHFNEPASDSTGNGERVPVRLLDIADKSAADVLAMVESHSIAASPPANGKRWKPWFPVIDYDRCTNCMQCLSFCLFGVYGATTDGKIQVQHESNCKTDCPACSRVCPEVAIMFPKYKAGPINGDVISSEDVRREAMKIDISALLGGDIYSMLRDRSTRAKSRFSKERDDQRALEERQRCLEKLKTTMDGLDIPPEVLASLPSVDQIQEKAAQAKRRAQEALASGQQSAVSSQQSARY
jgi:NAD-dependent dihydropyrimidine dehydrogenase PreA subunit